MKKVKILILICFLFLYFHAKQTTLIRPPFKHNMGFNRANNSIASMILGKKVKFHRTGGIDALKLRFKDDKTTNKDDAVLTVFGINNHQIIYNVGMRALKSYGKKGYGKDNSIFYYPWDIKVTEDGDVFISDTYNYRIIKLKYDSLTDSLIFIKQQGSFGIDSFSLDRPTMLDYDGNKNIYISDTGNNRIVVYDSLLYPIKILNNIKKPSGICIIDRKKGYCKKGRKPFIIIVSDNRYILKLSLRGDTIDIVYPQNITAYSNPFFNRIDYDYNGNIWVTDSLNSVIHKFDSDLNYIVSFGSEGFGDEQFFKPDGISIYRKFGQVFIGEKYGFQYFWIGVDGWIENLTPSIITDTTKALTIGLYATEQCKVVIDIMYDNKTIRKLAKYLTNKIGLNYIIWDLKDENGNRIEEKGKYKLKISLEAMYSSRSFFKKEMEAIIEKH